jgi:mannosyltransferase OCH1-like enzyme
MMFLSILMVVFQFLCHAGLIPDYDLNCDYLVDPQLRFEDFYDEKYYFKKPVPRMIHQIWFGPANEAVQLNVEKWQDYCNKFDFEYHFWTEKDFLKMEDIMDDRNYELMRRMLRYKNYWAASDILRLSLIHYFGGVYLDCDFSPPVYNSEYVDIFSFVNDQGLTLCLEQKSRNIGSESAIFCSNAFICSNATHPVILKAVDKVFENAIKWHDKKNDFNAMYCTGPFFLNRVLSGTYGVISMNLLRELKMTNVKVCRKCKPKDCEGDFCRCESRNIKVGKKLREKGKSPWLEACTLGQGLKDLFYEKLQKSVKKSDA